MAMIENSLADTPNVNPNDLSDKARAAIKSIAVVYKALLTCKQIAGAGGVVVRVNDDLLGTQPFTNLDKVYAIGRDLVKKYGINTNQQDDVEYFIASEVKTLLTKAQQALVDFVNDKLE